MVLIHPKDSTRILLNHIEMHSFQSFKNLVSWLIHNQVIQGRD